MIFVNKIKSLDGIWVNKMNEYGFLISAKQLNMVNFSHNCYNF